MHRNRRGIGLGKEDARARDTAALAHRRARRDFREMMFNGKEIGTMPDAAVQQDASPRQLLDGVPGSARLPQPHATRRRRDRRSLAFGTSSRRGAPTKPWPVARGRLAPRPNSWRSAIPTSSRVECVNARSSPSRSRLLPNCSSPTSPRPRSTQPSSFRCSRRCAACTAKGTWRSSSSLMISASSPSFATASTSCKGKTRRKRGRLHALRNTEAPLYDKAHRALPREAPSAGQTAARVSLRTGWGA